MYAQQHLFELINAAPGLHGLRLVLAIGLANNLIYLVPLGMAIAWLKGSTSHRQELLQALYCVLLALVLAQLVAWFWPQPRPAALHLGQQYLAHTVDPGLPSDHVAVLWSLALAALASTRYAALGFPLLAAGLAVGWARVYVGVHFPLDVLAALPVAAAGLGLAKLLRGASERYVSGPLLALYAGIERHWHRRRFPHNDQS